MESQIHNKRVVSEEGGVGPTPQKQCVTDFRARDFRWTDPNLKSRRWMIDILVPV